MNANGSLRDVENLRFRIQMNNRLRLECLAAVSKVFREFAEPINDELLSSIVFALPQELISGNGHRKAQGQVTARMNAAENEQVEKGIPPEEPQQPTLPPEEPEPEKPGLPPEEPEPAPELPPESPEEAPALPPVSPSLSAIA
jgi:hypothetical protein